MVVFWILATLMTAVALAFVLVPLLRARALRGPSQSESNLAVLRGQRREIEADVANGILPADVREEALAELVDRAQADLSTPDPTTPAQAKQPWIAAAVAVVLPLLAFGTYVAMGTPAATDPKLLARGADKVDDARIVAMVESLAKKVRDRPDDAQGWALLARSMAALGRFKESAQAYEHLAKLAPTDPQVLADYADALGMAQGGTLAGRPRELASQALSIDPKHRKALALAGTAAMDAGDYPGATKHWQTLAAELTPGSEDELQVRAILDEIKLKAAAAGQALPAPSKTAPKVAATAPAAAVASVSVSGSVSIAPAIASKVDGTETLWIFARAESGSRIPLAVLRATAKQLPMAFALDDSMAMAPTARISQAQAVRVEARISRSGSATPQSGDLVGASVVVKPGARDVKVVVDKVQP
jgi:cytochrome c-type biogenesis protein CcmH